jgi:hypothetical protein
MTRADIGETAWEFWQGAFARLVERDPAAAIAHAQWLVERTLDAAGQVPVTGFAQTPTRQPIDDSLGVPANLRLVEADVAAPHRALLTLAWDAVQGANGYAVCHSFGNPYAPSVHLILMTEATEATVGATEPFVVQPGQPYTVAVYGMSDKGLGAVPAVLEVQVPAYIPPPPVDVRFPDPVAWAPGQVVDDSLVLSVLVGGPGGKKQVAFRHAKAPEVADSGAATVVIDAATAQELGLPHLGAAPFTGVGGQADGYWTECDLEFPGNGYVAQNVAAAVLPSFGECLIGFNFPESLGLVMCVDTVRGILSYFRASDFWAPPASPAAGG